MPAPLVEKSAMTAMIILRLRLTLSDNNKLGHEFEHGRQVLDGEMSFSHYRPGDWISFAHDRTDEAKAWAVGFSIVTRTEV